MEKAEEGVITERGLRIRESLLPLGAWSAAWAEDVYGFVKPGGYSKE